MVNQQVNTLASKFALNSLNTEPFLIEALWNWLLFPEDKRWTYRICIRMLLLTNQHCCNRLSIFQEFERATRIVSVLKNVIDKRMPAFRLSHYIGGTLKVSSNNYTAVVRMEIVDGANISVHHLRDGTNRIYFPVFHSGKHDSALWSTFHSKLRKKWSTKKLFSSEAEFR